MDPSLDVANPPAEAADAQASPGSGARPADHAQVAAANALEPAPAPSESEASASAASAAAATPESAAASLLPHLSADSAAARGDAASAPAPLGAEAAGAHNVPNADAAEPANADTTIELGAPVAAQPAPAAASALPPLQTPVPRAQTGQFGVLDASASSEPSQLQQPPSSAAGAEPGHAQPSPAPAAGLAPGPAGQAAGQAPAPAGSPLAQAASQSSLPHLLTHQKLPPIQSIPLHEDGDKVVLPGISKGYQLPSFESQFGGKLLDDKSLPHLPALKPHFDSQMQLPRLQHNLQNVGQYVGLPLPMMQYKQDDKTSRARPPSASQPRQPVHPQVQGAQSGPGVQTTAALPGAATPSAATPVPGVAGAQPAAPGAATPVAAGTPQPGATSSQSAQKGPAAAGSVGASGSQPAPSSRSAQSTPGPQSASLKVPIQMQQIVGHNQLPMHLQLSQAQPSQPSRGSQPMQPRQQHLQQPGSQQMPKPQQMPQGLPQPQQLMMGYMPMYPYAPQQFSPASPLAYLAQPPLTQGMPAAAAAALSGVAQMPGVAPGEYRPLNVKDALTYLEQVKLHFANQPDVYNHFLDIMKDFKSHSIDTPGVIDRVSSLFRGHPNLIQGFNTFLPAGYSIICSTDPNDPHPIRVTTPMGTQTLPQLLPRKGAAQAAQPQPQPQPAQRVPSQPQAQPQSQPQRALPAQHQQQPPPPQAYPYAPNAQNIVHAHVDRATPGGPVEFSHAISYVNRIKNHFSTQPEIYKQFLEILQTYQREQLRISQVYAQVRELFQDAPDLLEGFRNFLPDADAEAEDLRLPPIGNFGPPQGVNASAPTGPAFGSFPPPPPREEPPPPRVYQQPAAPSRLRAPYAPSTRAAKKAEKHSDEIAFFERVKRALPKDTYHEFLKVLNLFTQRIIDVPTLIEHVTPFLENNKELMDWFTNFVGFDGEPLHIENISQRKHVIDLSKCRAYGRSYRMLPKTEKFMQCTGRDELCWEVLNDEWVGHPTWASEDSGYIAHRKNQYEEILHRVEEERHEYDHYIGANQRTIQVLETISDRLARMSKEEAARFTLPEGLGHGNKIYQKIIRKIYDKKNGAEVIRALHETPAAAVPVVLRRLKQKDEEWHRAHREWNKVWREAERKAFYKSLDHVGLTFKQADRKYLTPRSLLAEIMVVKTEQGAKRKLASTNLAPLPPPRSQIDCAFDDREVINDLTDLILRYISARPIMSVADKERARKFLTAFVDELFAQGPIEEKLSALGRKNGEELKRKSQKDPADPAAAADESTAADEDAMDVDKDLDVDALVEVADPSWLKIDKGTLDLNRKEPHTHFNLFANTPIYLFLRIFQILYVRLREVKSVEPIVSKTLAESKKTQFAIDLGLYDTKLETLGLQFSSTDVYQQTLQLCRRVIDDDVEPQWFEEALRQAYRNRAYKLYTIDKALQSLIKYLHAIIVDDKCLDALMLWEHDRAQRETDLRTQIELRAASRRIYRGSDAPDPTDPLFRICWIPEKSLLTFQSIGPFDLSLKEAQQSWEYYVTSYTMSLPTEGVPLNKIHAPFLQRTLKLVDGEPDFAVLKDGLEAEIALNSYHLDFRPGTSDIIVRNSAASDAQPARQRRAERWGKTLESAEAALVQNEKEALESRMVVDAEDPAGPAGPAAAAAFEYAVPGGANSGAAADAVAVLAASATEVQAADAVDEQDMDATDELTDPMETDDANEDTGATGNPAPGSPPTAGMLSAQPSHAVAPVEIVLPLPAESGRL